ncbi:MAG: hypothetical protein RLZZ182_349 [Pseudomonadota bacterium]|jgi:uncharacterized protein (DUF1501 family)
MNKPIMHPTLTSRREWLRQLSALSGLGVAAPFALNLAAMGEAAAQNATDYKALVCIFLQGGNDAFNTVLATDTRSWNAYTRARQQQPESLVLPRDQILSLNPARNQGRSFALHPNLTEVQKLFNEHKRLAILANVGTLIEPVPTKGDYERKTRKLPSKLFSHNDQQATWNALGPEGTARGWGGRMADMVASGNGRSLFTAISMSGNSVWLSGQDVRQYHMGPDGPITYGFQRTAQNTKVLYGSQQVAAAMDRIVRSSRTGSVFARDLADIGGRSMDAEQLLNQALPSVEHSDFGVSDDMKYWSPALRAIATNPLAQQLRMVARTIGARQALGMTRQVFFINLYNFDTHDQQLRNHGEMMARLNHALRYFDDTLGRMKLLDRVTTFTASDFGRTFTSNGDGTDHGWGAHHFIMGGAVQGGDIHGTFPDLGLKNADNNGFNSEDQLHNGVLLPRVSVEQYGATLARWFDTRINLQDVFPNLSNFSDRANLGFMKA